MILNTGWLIRKQFEIFETVRNAAFIRSFEGQGISKYEQWKAAQPGYNKLTPGQSLGTFGWLGTKEKDVFWDGTFSQPILPLTDSLHRDSKHIYTPC